MFLMYLNVGNILQGSSLLISSLPLLYHTFFFLLYIIHYYTENTAVSYTFSLTYHSIILWYYKYSPRRGWRTRWTTYRTGLATTNRERFTWAHGWAYRRTFTLTYTCRYRKRYRWGFTQGFWSRYRCRNRWAYRSTWWLWWWNTWWFTRWFTCTRWLRRWYTGTNGSWLW